jgi:acetyl-CoA synthetase
VGSRSADEGAVVQPSAQTETFLRARELLLDTADDHPRASAEFAWPQLETFNWARDWFDHLAATQGATAALWVVEQDGSEEKVSYAAMARRSREVAGWLRAAGLRRGDRVLLVLGNCVPLWELMLACVRLGAVMIPATTLLSPADLADRVERGRVSMVVGHDRDTGRLEPVARGRTLVAVGDSTPDGWLAYSDSVGHPPLETDEDTAADETLLLYFTSGTTASPKLVEHTHTSYPVGHLATMYWIGLRPGDVHLNISSPGWAKHAWSCLFAPWNAGATILIHNYTRFDPQALLDVMARTRTTTFCAPPTVWRMLIQADLQGHGLALREVVGAGEPLNPEIIEQVQQAWGLTIRDGFGQTETTAAIGNTPGQRLKPGSMGRPLPGYVMALVDPVSGEVRSGDGAEGEVCIDLAHRPLGLMVGYHGDAERTAEAMRGGYYHTGDVASVDADGYFTYVGRADDVFKASDYRISPFELESVLIEHPAVAEAAIVPSPDPVRLAVPKAFVVLAVGHEPDRATALSVLRHCREHLAAYKRVRRLEFVPAEGGLPKTVSGKIRRVELRAGEVEAVDAGRRGRHAYDEADFPELRA